ncbi:hypothetical protein TcWFU_006103 [Taenia crassiceps]|uniref:Uncharacterized protein n=1 Tax=Taenia crassiceps TaxID=6207 RepID=A0ABR4QR99_9CEST
MDTARWVVLSQLTIGGSVELILLLSSPPSLCYSTLLIFMEQKWDRRPCSIFHLNAPYVSLDERYVLTSEGDRVVTSRCLSARSSLISSIAAAAFITSTCIPQPQQNSPVECSGRQGRQ